MKFLLSVNLTLRDILPKNALSWSILMSIDPSSKSSALHAPLNYSWVVKCLNHYIPMKFFVWCVLRVRVRLNRMDLLLMRRRVSSEGSYSKPASYMLILKNVNKQDIISNSGVSNLSKEMYLNSWFASYFVLNINFRPYSCDDLRFVFLRFKLK